MNIDERLDLDNYIIDLSKKFPKNNDDAYLFIRAKKSTDELFYSCIADDTLSCEMVLTIALNNKEFREMIETVVTTLNNK